MNIKKMLKRESDTLLKDDSIGRRTDATDISMSIKFKDGHIHHVLPDKKQADELAQDLISHVNVDMTPTAGSSKQPPSEVVFKNRQAIGDILTFTSGVRDFKLSHPNTKVGVISTASHIWDNNPHIDQQFRDAEKIVEIGPGYLTNKSNTWNYHLCNAFRLSMEQKLGVSIIQGDTRPDIWLTEEEYHREPLIKGPYWIIIIGGEPGWTAKMWPEERWQEVVDSMPEIQFVQLGMQRHPYAHLNNVVDYIGKTEHRDTGVRDLFNIFLHAQGSVGLVSMHMHLSAAFNNPCVVVAGAREPAHFTNYMGHQYLQTNGTIPECAMYKSCWKTSLKPGGCSNHKDGIPKCVDIIHPSDVTNGIKKYYDGGRLEYGKKIRNTFFKNVTKEKKVFVVPTTTPVDNELLEKHGFQWGGGSITDRDWIFLKEIFEKEKVETILEFGAGLSTILFANTVKSVETYETQPGWIKKISDMAPENSVIKLWNGRIVTEPLKEKYDFAFVDGPAGGPNREWSTEYASKHADLVVVHDAGRKEERMWQAKHLEPNFKLAAKGGHRCHYWKRKKEISAVDTSKPLARVVTTCRGWGGSERSTVKIMNMLLDKGYRVDLVPKANISGEYLKNIPEEVNTIKFEELAMPSDITILYCSDMIWSFNDPQWDVMEELRTDRKVMILNYQLGGAGNVPWTLGWDKYMFLNSTKEQELLDRIPDAYTKVLPPPTDLTEFLKQEVDYEFPLKLIRHNSQGDAKHPDYTNEMIRDVMRIDSSVEFHYMPARSDCMNHPQVYKYPKNKPPVYDFLSKGNCFWYHLPPGYQDQGPRVIIEAMACGMPVIADNRYGAKDRVTPETGWLCEEREDYLKVISEIINNPEIIKIKGEAAREYAKKEYVAEKWVEEILGENIV